MTGKCLIKPEFATYVTKTDYKNFMDGNLPIFKSPICVFFYVEVTFEAKKINSSLSDFKKIRQ